jgi:nucleoside-diphosphate-sugar epimerase
MKIIVLGGCGYVGSVLVEKLLKKNYKVLVIDTKWFGNYLKKNKNLRVIKCDIRNLNKISFRGYNKIIHLANIANDPTADLDPTLSWEINVLSTHQIIYKAIDEGIEQFIFSSSGSVYGIKKENKVTEDLQPEPISVYNKTKMIAERVLLSFSDKINLQIIRPATVCGISPRMRLDLTVNLLTMQAITKKQITVLGGKQKRPNIHIQDLTDVFIYFLESKIKNGIYNAGFENLSILRIAKIVKNKIPSKIIIKKSNDIRSYNIDSSKLIMTGYKPKFSIEDAICQIRDDFLNRKFYIKKEWYSVNWLKKIKVI